VEGKQGHAEGASLLEGNRNETYLDQLPLKAADDFLRIQTQQVPRTTALVRDLRNINLHLVL
jgi:hypothetical protein